MPATNPNHHLWRNGRLWWIAFTVIHDGWRQERVRRSLGTVDLQEARRLRDDLLLEYSALPNAEVVALRALADTFRIDASLPHCRERAASPRFAEAVE